MTARFAMIFRGVAAACCAVAAGALVAGVVGMRAGASYESGLELQMARAGASDCGGRTEPPSAMARLGLRLRGTSAPAERWRLATELTRLSFHSACALPALSAADNDASADRREPYARLLVKVRTLAARDHGTERARTLGLLTGALIRASQIDSVNASAFVAEAETAARDAVRLQPDDSTLQTNLEVVLRLRRQEQSSERRPQKNRGQRATKMQSKAKQNQVAPNRKHRQLPGPGIQGGGGY